MLYAGHGSPRGWAGYQALRTRHVEELEMARPVDLTIAFACSTLSRPRHAWPFGSRLVELGVTRCYLAPAESVVTADAEALGDLVIELLASGRWASVGSLMSEIDRCAAGPARRAWSTFRLLGDPRTTFTSTPSSAVSVSGPGRPRSAMTTASRPTPINTLEVAPVGRGEPAWSAARPVG